MVRSPSIPRKFFKPLVPGFQNRLSIPVAFYRSLSGKKLDKALLESCLGSWSVSVRRNGDGPDGVLTFEQEGWKQFVRRHGLELGQFLVFEHKGHMVFHVVVYESRGCEKEFPPTNYANSSRMTPSRASISSNPESFRILMSTTHALPHKGYVTIPKNFVIANGLAGRSSMILSTFGKEWPVNVRVWQGGARYNPDSVRTAITAKGWCDFYADNNLKNGDVCTFKLRKIPKSSSKPVIMDVKISHSRF